MQHTDDEAIELLKATEGVRELTVLLTTSRVGTAPKDVVVSTPDHTLTPANVLLTLVENSLSPSHYMSLAKLVVDNDTGEQHYHPLRD